MFKVINGSDVYTTEQMESMYSGLSILYRSIMDNSMQYKGTVIAVSDFTDRDKLNELQMKYYNDGIDTSICYSDSANLTLKTTQIEIK